MGNNNSGSILKDSDFCNKITVSGSRCYYVGMVDDCKFPVYITQEKAYTTRADKYFVESDFDETNTHWIIKNTLTGTVYVNKH